MAFAVPRCHSAAAESPTARDAALADRDGEIQARDAALAEIQDLRGHLDDANEDRDFFERKYDKYKAEVFRTQS
ncbi:hypothetical protein JL721_12415 [Aureococcus anophagefferens]|nr:hypothetical protein JL721_12415 [Aureococcus anophagefferens]